MRKITWLFLLMLICLLSACGEKEVQETLPPQTMAATAVETAAVTEAAETEPVETVPEETVPETTQPTEPEVIASRIESGMKYWLGQQDVTWNLRDGTHNTRLDFWSTRDLMLKSEEPFSGIYLMWDTIPGPFTVSWENGSLECGTYGFFHEYVYLPEPVISVTLHFHEERQIYVSEIYLYTEGTPPAPEVQEWLPPCEEADVLAFPTHSDDECLFFGALISQSAIERGLKVQTAFMTKQGDIRRVHERLNGLWEMGVRYYPVYADLPESASHSLEAMEYHHKDANYKGWQVAQIRRFKPLVIIGHDLNGEYGNGQHKLNALYLTDAVNLAADETQFEESAALYGTWSTPKLYLHLYWENEIVLDVNAPMENDPLGRTPFEAAQDAYGHHVTQHIYPNFYVAQDENPDHMDCKRFGLYHSLVGADTGADILENIDLEKWRE